MGCLCYCSWKGKEEVSLTPNPFPVSQAPLEHQGLSSLAWHSRGRQGRGRQLSTPSLPGKIPFHVAACDLSRRLCQRGGVQQGVGEVLQLGAPHSSTRQTAAPPETPGREGLRGCGDAGQQGALG